MEEDPQQRVKFLREKSSDDEDAENEQPKLEEDDIEFSPPGNVENDKDRMPFEPIFHAKPRVVFYPYSWKGPRLFSRKICDVYGLIICVHDKTCYILSSFGVNPYRPKYLKPGDKNLVGCWVLLEFEKDESTLASVPDFSKTPLHTRVFYGDGNGEFPSLLIYDHVKIIDEFTLESKFLGQIENNSVDLSHTAKPFCDIEYIINVGFKNQRFTYNCEAVKFHGAIPVYSGLPEILSHILGSDHKASFMSDRFYEAFFDPKEIEKKREERLQKQRDYLYRRNIRFAPYLKRENPTELNENQQGENQSKEVPEQINEEDDEFFKKAIDRSQQSSSQSKQNKMETPSPKVIRSRPVPVMKPSSSNSMENGGNNDRVQKSQKVVFITYAAAGYSLHLARYYLDNGHKVIAHVVDPDFETNVRALTNDPKRLAIVFGPVEESLEEMKKQNLRKRFGEIDVVFHFASAICKPGRDHGSYEQLRYLFEENVKPIPYIYRYLTNDGQGYFNKFKLIVVGPFYNPSAIKPKLLPNIKCFMSHLSLTINEISKSLDTFSVLTVLIKPDELVNGINPVVQGNTEEVCKALYEREIEMDFD